ncbi:MAG: C10 family peptidase [Bacteroidota bacterium]
MKRLAATLLLTLCFLSLMHAEPVDQQRARTVAVNWMLTHGGSEYSALSASDLFPFSRDGIVTHFVVNLIPDGFVIVAGDDIAVPVIMYGPTGKYDGVTIPPALKEMLDLYAGDLLNDIADRIPQPEAVGDLWSELSQAGGAQGGFFKGGGGNRIAAVSPLISATWNQTFPYNQDCPAATGGSGGHVYVGCVATAMAMVMHYHSYPVTGLGSHSYTHPTYGVQSADFGSTTYAWSSMPNSINTSSSSAAKAAIAQLSYHCGVSVDMDYSISGSGSSTSDARNSLVNYFRYDSGAQYRWRSSYSTSAWNTLLVDDLDNGRPVIYRGSEQNGSGGHAFIVDGYSGTDYFHMNFGWGGSFNGYLYLNDITPSSYEFTYWQGMITGIKPLPNVAPSLLSPPNLATDLCITPTVSWDAVATATTYRLQVSSNAAFSSTVYDNAALTTNSVTVPSLAAGSTYYWRVNVTSTAGTSPWSSVWHFTTREVAVTPGGATTFCEGGSVALNSSASGLVSFVWLRNNVPIPNAAQASYTATQSGSYVLSVIDNGCTTRSDPVIVTVTPLPLAEITTPYSSDICQGQSSILNAAQGSGYTYQWRKNSGDIPGATSATLSVTESGLYDVQVTSSGCSSTSMPVTVTVFPADPDAFVWTGNTNSDWSTAGNWDSPCAIPGSGDDVTIPSGVTPPSSIPVLTLGNLTVNNAAGISLSGTLVIDGVLTLQNGSISLGNNDLIISSTGSIAGAAAGRHIVTNGNGTLRQADIGSSGRSGAVIFPVGTVASSYTPVTLANAAGSNNFGVRVIEHVLVNGVSGAPVSAGIVDRTWFISAESGQSDVSLMFAWTAAEEISGFNRSQCFISRNETGLNWDAQQTAGAAQGTGQISRMISGITAFPVFGMPYAIGSGGTLYPVELLSFNADVINGLVHLNWNTVNEVNNYGFDVQRRNAGSAIWQNAGFVPATEATGGVHSYRWIDGSPLSGTAEYRLAQTDVDGSVNYSSVLSVGGQTANTISLDAVYPQPLLLGQDASVTITAGNGSRASLTLYDALGREALQLFDGVLVSGSSRSVSIPSSGLHPGTWFIRLSSQDGQLVRKFTVLQ